MYSVPVKAVSGTRGPVRDNVLLQITPDGLHVLEKSKPTQHYYLLDDDYANLAESVLLCLRTIEILRRPELVDLMRSLVAGVDNVNKEKEKGKKGDARAEG